METNSMASYLAVIRKRLWVILLVFAATMAIILVRAWQTPPAYRSTVSLAIIPSDPAEVTLFSRTQIRWRLLWFSSSQVIWQKVRAWQNGPLDIRRGG